MNDRKVRYIHARTDTEVRLLHKKGVWNNALEEIAHSKKQLGVLQKLLKHFYWYELARQRRAAAESEMDRHKKAILRDYPVDILPGFIGRRGRQWLRNLVVVPEASWVIKNPEAFVEHVGNTLPNVAQYVDVRLTPDEFLYLRLRYAKSYPERAPLKPIDVAADKLAIDKLVLHDKIKPVPADIADLAQNAPTLRVSFIKDPS